ncbi:MAG: zinc ribbon domain-containing protein [Acidobacteriota bacterium]
MHCPKCGQLQAADDTRFCSRCGLLLTGVAQVVAQGGVLAAANPDLPKGVTTPRNRGLKQGLFIFLLAFLVVPILTIISVALNAEPYAVVLAAIVLTVGGMLRAAYALMFESNVPILGASTTADAANLISGSQSAGSLPPQHTDLYASPAGSWRDTSDLLDRRPPSVTDSTTKLLQKELNDQ